MALTRGQADVIVRAYRVTLAPEGDPELAFEPFRITASYAADDPSLDGEKRDPHSDACRVEVERIANKKERREHRVPAEVAYDLLDFELVREFIVDKAEAR
jgi:hypothetical protein